MASRPDFSDDYDFVEKPSDEYFCPVTFELLTDPVETSCCGNNISRPTAERLQAEGKPCPLCQKVPLESTIAKYFKRKVMQLKVYCKNESAGSVKRGIKVWVRADSHNGYFSQFEVYQGKGSNTSPEFGLGGSVVKTLTRPLVVSGRENWVNLKTT